MAVELKIIDNKAVVLIGNTLSDDWEAVAENALNEWTEYKIKVAYVKSTTTSCSSVCIAEIYSWIKKLNKTGIECKLDYLPSDFKDLLRLTLNSANIPPEQNEKNINTLEYVGEFGYNTFKDIKKAINFIKEAFVSVFNFLTGKAVFRSEDFWFIFADCSYKAVGIISLVSFLVGLILAFVGAMQLKTFGAGIYVSSMVALGMTRIMAAIMVGIIMAGRTGSSYAATIGTMQVNEEIDALKTLGIKVTDFLVAPRIVALVLTIPILTIIADVLGILGGAVVGVCFLDLSSTTYWEYSIKALSWSNFMIGILHSAIYAVIISICGCYEGIYSGRNADSVGKATTSAVVTALVWMIVATGILTVILEVIGL